MKQPEIFRKIGAIILELNEQYEYMQTTPDSLNDLEVELFVANTHFLKDHAEILRKLNLIKSQTQLTLPEHTGKKAEPKYFEPLVQQPKVTSKAPAKPEPEPEKAEPITFEISPVEEQPAPQIDLSTTTDKDSYSFERTEPETIRHELIIDEADLAEEEEVSLIKPEPETAPVIEDKATVVEKPLADKPAEEVKPAEEEKPKSRLSKIFPTGRVPLLSIYADEPKAGAEKNEEPVVIKDEPIKKPEPVQAKAEEKVLTLNEKMSAQLKEKSSAAETSEPPITDIKAAISLNDKLLFVKDLFNGYSLAYSEAIEIVNRFTRFEEADRFLKTNYVTKNNWADKKATADKFYALLKRRYA
ncbi:hypothetical protein FFF34_010380 [Inquilinus sp. KBS0705]|nr:hypothetical protein FFF34_010380 [Inquilinus sp. KBS0705]